MKTYIPFWKIEKNANIVFYGCGKNSKICYQKLIDNQYCKLIGVVDRDYRNKSLNGICAGSLMELTYLNYDYIFITIVDKHTVEMVIKDLVRLGIKLSKICSMWDRIEAITLSQLENLSFINGYLEDMFNKRKEYAKKGGEYYPEIVSLIDDLKDRKKIFIVLKSCLCELGSKEPAILLFILMYEYQMFDKECLQMFMKCLLDIEWKDDSFYGIVIDTTYMIFLYPEYIYDDFFLDRRKLLYKICSYYNLDIRKNIAVSENEKKIAIVVNKYTPNNQADAVSMLIRSYAYEISKLGYKVKIFVLYSLVGAEYKKINIEKIFEKNDYECLEYYEKELKDNCVEIEKKFVPDVGKRLENNIKKIISYNPNFIIDMSDEMFPEGNILIKEFPIINMPMRNNSYSSVADAYIFRDLLSVKKDNATYRALDIKKVYELILGNMGIVKSEKNIYKREDFGFKDPNFLIVTVGSRLNLELKEDFIETICELLDENRNFIWVLVGDNVKCNSGKFKNKLSSGQIVNWGFENHLELLYRISDVYLNPDRKGGGVSIRLAMKNGLPVIMTSAFLDEEPKKNDCFSEVDKYRKLKLYIVDLSKDDILYQKKSDESKLAVSGLTIDSDAKKVIKLCEEIEREKNRKICGSI